MQRMLMLLSILLILIPLASASADEVTERHGFGLESGFMKLTGGEFGFSNWDQSVGIHYRYGLKPNWTLQAGLHYGQVHPTGDMEGTETVPFANRDEILTMVTQPSLDLLYHFTPEEKWSAYAGAGLGVAFVDVRDTRNEMGTGNFFGPGGIQPMGYNEDGELEELETTNFTASLLAGVEYFVTPDLVVGAGARYGWMAGGGLDNIGLSSPRVYDDAAFVDANDGVFDISLGFTWFFGSNDSDRDGIPNKLDACPKLAEDFDGFEDEDGCPEDDNDLDGIADADDRCPNEAEDMDGFQDSDGCPDLDNDGDMIPDRTDRCPDEAEDMDGFQDRDGCPDPDNDGDGVLDAADNCPRTPRGVEVDAHGCPIVEEIRDALTLTGVTFNSGSADLAPESMAVLDRVGESLIAWPEVKIEVQGHSDSRGNDQMNLELSQARAETVASYLVGLGVDSSRITARGYGETMFIAENDTKAGRAANRRVEIHRVDR